MGLRDEPHYQIEPSKLADWLESQGTDIWWSVDGDRFLTGRISFPCPADELASLLRQVNRPLLVRDLSNSPTAVASKSQPRNSISWSATWEMLFTRRTRVRDPPG